MILCCGSLEFRGISQTSPSIFSRSRAGRGDQHHSQQDWKHGQDCFCAFCSHCTPLHPVLYNEVYPDLECLLVIGSERLVSNSDPQVRSFLSEDIHRTIFDLRTNPGFPNQHLLICTSSLHVDEEEKEAFYIQIR